MNKLATEILDTVEVGALATVNRDRTPLVAALHFARLDDVLVWVSDPASRHAHNAFRTGKAEFVVWDKQKNAVFLTTTVREIVDEAELAAAQKAYTKKLGDFMPQVDTPRFYAMPIGQLDEKTTTGNWLHFIA
ncbi:pyridoxamine 5'-phosphate oxidase family protein [Candidatus Saccharibacteria bacterium oral taxon 488]|nr:pyridoxamine 5'-phosphate oxidase family protein [Candidatus Saccharibacteria bacterium oral taxon 488]